MERFRYIESKNRRVASLIKIRNVKTVKSTELVQKRCQMMTMKRRMEKVLKGLESSNITKPVQMKLYRKGQVKMWRPPVLIDRLQLVTPSGKDDDSIQEQTAKNKFIENIPKRNWNRTKARQSTSAGPEIGDKKYVSFFNTTFFDCIPENERKTKLRKRVWENYQRQLQ